MNRQRLKWWQKTGERSMSLGLAHHNTWCRFILFHLCYSLNSPFHGCMVYGYKTCDTEYDVLVLAGFMNHLVWATRILSQHVHKYGHLCGCSWACFIYNFNGQCFLTLAWQYGQLFLCMCLTNFFFFGSPVKKKKKQGTAWATRTLKMCSRFSMIMTCCGC